MNMNNEEKTVTLKQDYQTMKKEMEYYKRRCQELMLEIIRFNRKTLSKQKNKGK